MTTADATIPGGTALTEAGVIATVLARLEICFLATLLARLETFTCWPAVDLTCLETFAFGAAGLGSLRFLGRGSRSLLQLVMGQQLPTQ
ncbi:hypothetical protein PC129_g14744 [Phytophthora cactorum]|uniref:Uncharacterized protein n=1 Tax=Phytophthora cactorum TaxID=29920 RepID=A0A8T1HNP9_9STRA|nr:hypothetical protein PC111_g21304 [Phytophthora cactorum]KAG2809791.1 hypothetical protein PC112_g16357 [Phytophthora cactorum]KAG2850893.1 hypothetical protein PC113_g16385 [Phytophthora cactorum]KAG2890295.1 hypothetical protein PC114_g17540 [Phytophthora cactorum]KAG2999115.1 hypothetical protein PC119_g17299 [Phytophthora cactorum]